MGTLSTELASHAARLSPRPRIYADANVPAGLAGTHEWKVTAEPAVPGLAYSLTLESWVPWEIVADAPEGDSVSCSWSGDRLDVFVSRDGGALWYRAL